MKAEKFPEVREGLKKVVFHGTLDSLPPFIEWIPETDAIELHNEKGNTHIIIPISSIAFIYQKRGDVVIYLNNGGRIIMSNGIVKYSTKKVKEVELAREEKKTEDDE